MNGYALIRKLSIPSRRRLGISQILTGGSLNESTVLQHLSFIYFPADSVVMINLLYHVSKKIPP